MAARPRRRIPGTDAYAETVYRSDDGTLRAYTIIAADGTYLGNVTSHSRTLARAAGYHEGLRAFDHRMPTFRNLTEAAEALAARKAGA
jgi:hypothetical protein